MPRQFKDHFSAQAEGYARFRPQYPAELFAAIREQQPGLRSALDCATGNGQLALDLAKFCERVVAIDASAEQIANAIPHPSVEYRVAPAEATGSPNDAFDLLTVGQALHWFDFERFASEAERVVVPGGLIVAVSYATCTVDENVDREVAKLYTDLLDPYWPPERAIVEQGYAGIELPGTRLDFPLLDMSASWTVEDMLGYLRTWSATRRYERDHGSDPVELVEAGLRGAWGDACRVVRWPLAVRASKLPGP